MKINFFEFMPFQKSKFQKMRKQGEDVTELKQNFFYKNDDFQRSRIEKNWEIFISINISIENRRQKEGNGSEILHS